MQMKNEIFQHFRELLHIQLLQETTKNQLIPE